MTDDVGYLPRLARRSELVDYLEGYPLPAAADMEHPDAGRKLVKTCMLETAGRDGQMPDMANRSAGRVDLHRLDDTLYRVEDAGHGGRVGGLIEELDERHPRPMGAPKTSATLTPLSDESRLQVEVRRDGLAR